MFTPLWCPGYYSMAASIEFWLDHPGLDPGRVAATRRALPSMLDKRLLQCWTNLYLELGRLRQAGPLANQDDVHALLEELREAGQGIVEKEERLDLKPRLLRSTQAEFEWHRRRIREIVLARLSRAPQRQAA
jgi:hypothetical protein